MQGTKGLQLEDFLIQVGIHFQDWRLGMMDISQVYGLVFLSSDCFLVRGSNAKLLGDTGGGDGTLWVSFVLYDYHGRFHEPPIY